MHNDSRLFMIELFLTLCRPPENN